MIPAANPERPKGLCFEDRWPRFNVDGSVFISSDIGEELYVNNEDDTIPDFFV